MATEPERPIEELLRDAAKKRAEQAGGPFELHPATRRVLQTEVSRKFEKRAEDEPAAGVSLLQLLPRLIWGATICGVLALMIWIVIPKPERAANESRLAELAPAAPATDTPPEPLAAPAEPAATTPAATAPAIGAKSSDTWVAMEKQKEPSSDAVKSITQNSPALVPPMAAPASQALPAETRKTDTAAVADKAAPAPQESLSTMADRNAAKDFALPAPPSSPPAREIAAVQPKAETSAPASMAPTPVPGSLASEVLTKSPAPMAGVAMLKGSANGLGAATARATSGAIEKSTETLTNSTRLQFAAKAPQFYRVGPEQEKKENPNSGATSAFPVLATFRIEQSGSELRIIDADGSVYKGYVQPATAASRRRAVAAFGGAPRTLRTAGQDEASPSGGAASSERGMQDYTFSVSGTSATLHKKVTFQGTLNTASPLTLYKTASADTNLVGASGGISAGIAALANARVSGTVAVSGAKEFNLEAETRSPASERSP